LPEILLNGGNWPRLYNDEGGRRSASAEAAIKENLILRIILFALVILIIAFLVPRLFSASRAVPGVGKDAPEFSLKSQNGDMVSLKDYYGGWIVLYFYPKDQTPGCTREAHNFQVDQSKYAERHVIVLGVSVDDVDSHKKFCAKEGLNFKLLADTDGRVSKAYGSLTNLGIVKLAARHTFIIDPNGKIARSYTSVDPARHSQEILAALDGLQKR
jgi:peroxiredoxin Q/BCP